MSLLLLVIGGFFFWQPTVSEWVGGWVGVKARYSFSVQAGWGANDDYWSEDFDNNKNCEQEKKIIELNKEVGAHAKIVLCSFRQAETI